MVALPDPVRRLLAAQYNLITRRQALRAGMRPAAFDGLAQRGSLERVLCGVYRPSGLFVPSEQSVMAASLRAGEGALVTGEVACALYGLEGFSLRDPLTVLVPGKRRVGNVSFTVRRDRTGGAHRALVGSIPAVTPAMALVDAGLTVTDKRLRVGIDAAKWMRLLDNGRLESCVEAMGPRHRGAARVRGLLLNGHLEQESEGERALGRLLQEFDPPPCWQVWILPRIRVDAAWAPVRLALEYDGEAYHGPARSGQDAARDLAVKAADWELLRIRRSMLATPKRTLQQIRAVYAARSARILG